MIKHDKIKPLALHHLIRTGKIMLAGNSRLRIYGTLHCVSGKRMKKENRIFFLNESEARAAGFRPCGHCMKKEFAKWKQSLL